MWRLMIWALFLPAAGSAASGDVIYVDADAPLGGNGGSWNSPYTFLQDALAVVQPGDEIRVGGGIYHPDRNASVPGGTGDRLAFFGLPEGVSILGGFAGFGSMTPNARDPRLFETVLSGDLAGNDQPGFINREENSLNVAVADHTGATTLLDGLTIAGGYADKSGEPRFDSGAGVWIAGTDVTLRNCLLGDNYARDGAGLYLEGPSVLIVMDCRYENNSANSRGGAMYVDRDNRVSVQDSEFAGNYAVAQGGAVYSTRSRLQLEGCAFESNEAGVNAGAVAFRLSLPQSAAIDCSFSSNRALEDGGAIWCLELVAIERCTFENNTSLRNGGAAWFGSAGGASIRHSTFTGNLANNGGGMYCNGADATLEFCEFRANVAENVKNPGGNGGGLLVDNANAVVADCIFEGNSVTSNGGGVGVIARGRPSFERCRFIGNQAHGGAGLSCGADARVANSLFVGNVASFEAGGAAMSDGTMTHCTFVGNSGQVGALMVGSAVVVSSVSWDNTPADIGTTTSSAVIENCLWGEPNTMLGTGSIIGNPRFVNAALGDYRLASNSPCIDTGSSTQLPPGLGVDLAGAPRAYDDPNNPNIGLGLPLFTDMGAYEFQGESCYPDCDGSGSLDIFDFLCFQDAFTTMGPYADCDGNASFDVFDFLCFQDAFVAGCP